MTGMSSPSEEHASLQALAGKLGPKFTTPDTVLDPERARALYERIKNKRHPLTEEGVVMTPLEGGTPVKIKFRPEYDVVVRKIFEARAKNGRRAGGFEYSRILENGKKGEGKVGTGFSHDTLRDMLENPEDYEGRVAKVEAQSEFPSGALRAPSFKAFHEDPIEKQADLVSSLAKKLHKTRLKALREAAGSMAPERAKKFLASRFSEGRAAMQERARADVLRAYKEVRDTLLGLNGRKVPLLPPELSSIGADEVLKKVLDATTAKMNGVGKFSGEALWSVSRPTLGNVQPGTNKASEGVIYRMLDPHSAERKGIRGDSGLMVASLSASAPDRNSKLSGELLNTAGKKVWAGSSYENAHAYKDMLREAQERAGIEGAKPPIMMAARGFKGEPLHMTDMSDDSILKKELLSVGLEDGSPVPLPGGRLPQGLADRELVIDSKDPRLDAAFKVNEVRGYALNHKGEKIPATYATDDKGGMYGMVSRGAVSPSNVSMWEIARKGLEKSSAEELPATVDEFKSSVLRRTALPQGEPREALDPPSPVPVVDPRNEILERIRRGDPREWSTRFKDVFFNPGS